MNSNLSKPKKLENLEKILSKWLVLKESQNNTNGPKEKYFNSNNLLFDHRHVDKS